MTFIMHYRLRITVHTKRWTNERVLLEYSNKVTETQCYNKTAGS